MAGSATRRSGRNQLAATPLHGATWQATVLDAGVVQDELNRLWSDLQARSATGPEPPADRNGHAEASVADAHPPIVRANTLNLVAVARSAAEAERIERAIGYLGDFYPARAIVLVADPALAGPAEGGLDVRVSLFEQATKDRPATRFECVTVTAGALAASRFASIVSSLLVPELSDFLWWPGDNLGSALFQDLIETVDRLILDGAALQDPVMGLRALAAQVARPLHCPRVTDFAWLRLKSWRAMIAQFFDAAEARRCLDALDTVDLVYAPRAHIGSGLTAALLMAGWLGSRLDWRILAPLERTRTGWRAEVKSPSGPPALLRLRPAEDGTIAPGLIAVEIVAKRPHPGAFRVRRITATALTTASETGTGRPVGRMVVAEDEDEAALLGRSLHTFGRDPVYEDALTYAARLLPTSPSKEGPP
jgi:glucose-6-phosphate dehydrogenase assembly protein OpcA